MNHGNQSLLGITLCVRVCLPVLGLLSGIHPGAGGVAPVGFISLVPESPGWIGPMGFMDGRLKCRGRDKPGISPSHP